MSAPTTTPLIPPTQVRGRGLYAASASAVLSTVAAAISFVHPQQALVLAVVSVAWAGVGLILAKVTA